MNKKNQFFPKRTLSFLLACVIVLFCMAGCKRTEPEQSEIILADYVSEVKALADSYGYEMFDLCDYWRNIGQEHDYAYNIHTSDSADIYIFLYFTPENDDSVSARSGSIKVDYTIDTNRQEEEFDTGLFLKIVNLVSDLEIPKEYCDGFLEAARQDSDGGQNMKRCKNKYFDFFNHRHLGYILGNNDVATLSFGGVTKLMSE